MGKVIEIDLRAYNRVAACATLEYLNSLEQAPNLPTTYRFAAVIYGRRVHFVANTLEMLAKQIWRADGGASRPVIDIYEVVDGLEVQKKPAKVLSFERSA
jgi:hypothetical protein